MVEEGEEDGDAEGNTASLGGQCPRPLVRVLIAHLTRSQAPHQRLGLTAIARELRPPLSPPPEEAVGTLCSRVPERSKRLLTISMSISEKALASVAVIALLWFTVKMVQLNRRGSS